MRLRRAAPLLSMSPGRRGRSIYFHFHCARAFVDAPGAPGDARVRSCAAGKGPTAVAGSRAGRSDDLTVDPAFDDRVWFGARARASPSAVACIAAAAVVAVTTRAGLGSAAAALTEGDADNDDRVEQELGPSAQEKPRIPERRACAFRASCSPVPGSRVRTSARSGVASGASRAVAGELAFDDRGGNLVWGQPGRVVALLGVEGLAVVDSGDALLVARLDRSNDVREVVKALKAGHRSDVT